MGTEHAACVTNPAKPKNLIPLNLKPKTLTLNPKTLQYDNISQYSSKPTTRMLNIVLLSCTIAASVLLSNHLGFNGLGFGFRYMLTLTPKRLEAQSVGTPLRSTKFIQVLNFDFIF